jgi:hypothetical protein
MCAPNPPKTRFVELVEGAPAMPAEPAEPAEPVETRVEVVEEEWAAVRG